MPREGKHGGPLPCGVPGVQHLVHGGCAVHFSSGQLPVLRTHQRQHNKMPGVPGTTTRQQPTYLALRVRAHTAASVPGLTRSASGGATPHCRPLQPCCESVSKQPRPHKPAPGSKAAKAAFGLRLCEVVWRGCSSGTQPIRVYGSEQGARAEDA